jgi:hypothetical protein
MRIDAAVKVDAAKMQAVSNITEDGPYPAAALTVAQLLCFHRSFSESTPGVGIISLSSRSPIGTVRHLGWLSVPFLLAPR